MVPGILAVAAVLVVATSVKVGSVPVATLDAPGYAVASDKSHAGGITNSGVSDGAKNSSQVRGEGRYR